MADIFLSYDRQDVEWAKSLVKVLEGRGWSVWLDDQIGIGQRFEQVIIEELTKANCVIVLWSEESVNSDWVRSEAQEALNRNKALVPVLIDKATLPMGFRGIETARLYDWRGDLDHPELKLLLRTVAGIIGQPPKPVETQRRSWPWLSPESGESKRKYAILVALAALVILAIAVYWLKNRQPREDRLRTLAGDNPQSTNPPVNATPSVNAPSTPAEPVGAREPSKLMAKVERIEVDSTSTQGAQVFVKVSVRNTGPPSIAENFRLNIKLNRFDFSDVPQDLSQDYTFTPAGKASKVVVRREESLAERTATPIANGGREDGWVRFVVPDVNPNDLTQPGAVYTIHLTDVWGKTLSATHVLH